MPRGRKKKVITVDTVSLFSEDDLAKKNYYRCDVCGKYFRYSPFKINLSYFLGKASYHRRCASDSLAMCDDCSLELSSVVDNWLIRKNGNLEKFR